MTSIAILPETRYELDRPELFISKGQKRQQRTSGNLLTEWLERSPLLFPVQSFSLPAGNTFFPDQLLLKFRLREEYQHNFVLLRGLLEFSRPKKIVITANNSERTFEMWLTNDQAPDIIHYLEAIITRLLSEIKFKASLKMIIKYEERVRREQENLYKALGASMR